MNKVSAALLSIIAPGSGSVARGRTGQGAAIYCALHALPALLALEAVEELLGFALAGGALLVWTALALWLAVRGSGPASLPRLRWLAVPFALIVHPVLLAANLWYLAPIAPFQVPSDSMSPTLKTGDFFWIERQRWPARDIRRGDVIVFDETIYNTDFHVVKRVVAMARPPGGEDLRPPGDFVEGVLCRFGRTERRPATVYPAYPLKCRRWLDARRIVKQVKHRAANAKGSHFLRGNLETLNALLGDPTRLVYEVVVVQPGLSTTPKDTVLDLLTAADEV